MRISTKGRYALEAIVLLAARSKETGAVSIRKIANETGISYGYLEQLFTLLRKCGLILSKKGSKGGYLLSRAASSITVGEVYLHTEGSIALVGCDDEEPPYNTEKSFIIPDLWNEIDDTIAYLVNNITIESLASCFLKRESEQNYNYNI